MSAGGGEQVKPGCRAGRRLPVGLDDGWRGRAGGNHTRWNRGGGLRMQGKSAIFGQELEVFGQSAKSAGLAPMSGDGGPEFGREFADFADQPGGDRAAAPAADSGQELGDGLAAGQQDIEGEPDDAEAGQQGSAPGQGGAAAEAGGVFRAQRVVFEWFERVEQHQGGDIDGELGGVMAQQETAEGVAHHDQRQRRAAQDNGLAQFADELGHPPWRAGGRAPAVAGAVHGDDAESGIGERVHDAPPADRGGGKTGLEPDAGAGAAGVVEMDPAAVFQFDETAGRGKGAAVAPGSEPLIEETGRGQSGNGNQQPEPKRHRSAFVLAHQDESGRGVADLEVQDLILTGLFDGGGVMAWFILPEAQHEGVGGAGGLLAQEHELGEARFGIRPGIGRDGGQEQEIALRGDSLVVPVEGEQAVAESVDAGLDGLAAAVGMAFLLTPDDHIYGSHRSHGEILAKGFSAIRKLSDAALLDVMRSYRDGVILAPVEKVWRGDVKGLALRFFVYGAYSEIFARETGFNRGLGGSMHAFFAPFGIYPNNAIVGGCDGHLRAIDISTGKETWWIEADGPIAANPVLQDGRIYFATMSSSIFCVDTAGKAIWQVTP